ncbi:hypothetical protein PIB30_057565 [Stylosanthes scabra]|uniref:Benzyl alcohol O-benzoyltransferase n=1 Tax=Stylosanthes scabra TaxID=79078 RepID=A0ABU6ZID2_9FABA|nr:hypothetical protein [Stylosanthes scabra]
MNHTICDVNGFEQFTKAIIEIAYGAEKPSIMPVWRRELLCETNPPRVRCIHHEYDQLPLDNKSLFKPYHSSFFFGPKEIHALRCCLPGHLAESSTTFDVLTACLWRCRTAALQWQNPNQEVRLLSIVNARRNSRFNPPLPKGFYGNAIVFPAAVSTVGKICGSPLSYVLELVKKAKSEVSEEYFHSVVDLLAINGRACFTRTGSFVVSDLSRTGFRDANYGWGKPLYSGLAKAGFGDILGVSFYVPHTNSKGEHGTVVPICLPEEAMVRFEEELNEILNFEDGKEESVTILRSNI